MQNKKLILIFTFVFLSFFSANKSLSQSVLSFDASISSLSGYTEYKLFFQGTDVVQDTLFVFRRIESLLEFPIDSKIAKIQATFHSGAASSKSWSVVVSYSKNLSDPGEFMKDSDWDEIVGYFPRTKFSYTESAADMNFAEFNIKADYQIMGSKSFSTFLSAGLKSQKISYEIDNFSGWFRFYNDATISYLPRDTILPASNLPALFYEVKYKMPYLGLGIESLFSENNFLKISGGYSVVFAEDFDDHLLRKKISTSEGNGRAFMGELRAHFVIGSISNKSLYVELAGEALSILVKDTQTQSWYGDDPATPGDSVFGIPHTFKSEQFKIGLAIGLEI